MATIKHFGIFGHLRSEASNYVIQYRSGKKARSGRGLAFWFFPQGASISELPVDDRDMSLFIKGRTQDFQEVSLQGEISWHIDDPEIASERIDFSVNLVNGTALAEPIDRIENRITGLASQAVVQYFAEASIRTLLDAGLDPVRARIESVLIGAAALSDIGVKIVTVRLSNITPTAELERALQTPTFEGLQQKADEAVFERRALAVDKERAIAENELANKTELAKRETQLIAQESENAKSRAIAVADAGQIEADAKANRIRTIESAQAEAEQHRMTIYKDLPSHVLLGLAARQFADKLQTINSLNVTPDLLSALVGELGKGAGKDGK
jgi:regulator of protease activity HflC (stomatin/prohibitin superfamily)